MVLSDDPGFKALFLAYSHELQVFLTRKLGCPQTAADLVQETLLRVATQPDSTMIENPRAYLYRTAQNLAIDHFRKEERRDTHSMDTEQLLEVPDESPLPEEVVASRQRLQFLLQAIAELPPLTQRIFTLNRIEGFGYAEVARMLDVSESTVQKHLAKALCHAMQSLKGFVIR